MSAKPTQPEPTKKKSPRTESDETTALRALRTLRMIDERLVQASARYERSVRALREERNAISASLSPSVAALVAKLVPAKEEKAAE
jgi:hypothetical protein